MISDKAFSFFVFAGLVTLRLLTLGVFLPRRDKK